MSINNETILTNGSQENKSFIASLISHNNNQNQNQNQNQNNTIKKKTLKRKRKPRKKKKKKSHRQSENTQIFQNNEKEEDDVEIEYVSEPLFTEGKNASLMDTTDPSIMEAFKGVFQCFASPEELCLSKEEREKKLQEEQQQQQQQQAKQKKKPTTSEQQENDDDDDDNENKSSDNEDEEDKSEESVMSKRERKKQKRLSVAVLKQIVYRPDLVEAWDVTASDPALLVHLKSYRNTVPVPRHWSQKRKYLQGKRGIEKPPFELPDFIADTGITKIRQAIQEQEDSKKLKQRQREKMQPKMGKMDIDYQVLHDAFFKYQTKPDLTIIGDLYYEGKEFEVKLKEKRPGILSDDLKNALGMPEGAPPPWLINMQRYGPPPSYPNLKIPGLNAPIPLGSSFGYHPGGWGKPPVDQYGKPLYGDVFGTTMPVVDHSAPIDTTKWGELEEEEEETSSEEEESESEEESEEEGEGEEEGMDIGRPDLPHLESGMVTPTGIATPDHLVLRKKVESAAAPPPPPEASPEAASRPLYQVLQQKEVNIGGSAFGSTHAYVLGPGGEEKDKDKAKKKGAKEAVNIIKSQKSKEVALTLDASELEDITEEELKERYENELAASAQRPQEDVSDIVAEHTKKKQKKEKKEKEKDKDKYKFKF